MVDCVCAPHEPRHATVAGEQFSGGGQGSRNASLRQVVG